jgi:hypothetical protein
MTITTQIRFSFLAFLAACAPSQAFGQDAGKAPLNASAAVDSSSETSTGRIVGDTVNSISRTKDVKRISEGDTLALSSAIAANPNGRSVKPSCRLAVRAKQQGDLQGLPRAFSSPLDQSGPVEQQA